MEMETPWKTWKRLNEYFPNWETAGIFQTLQKSAPTVVPWSAEEAQNLDFYYHGIRSGNKIAAEGLETFSNLSIVPFSTSVSGLVLSKFSKNWAKLYETLNLEYNPINNYDMKEEATDTRDNTRTPNLNRSTTRTPDLTEKNTRTETPGVTTITTRTPDLTETTDETRTPDLTETTDETRTPDLTDVEKVENRVADTENNIFGFDSAAAVPSDTSKTTENGQTTKTTTGTETDNTTRTNTGTEKNAGTKTTSGTETLEESHTGANETVDTTEKTGTETVDESETGNEKTNETTTHKLTRSGNIGVTTSQQMIQSERDLWIWNFVDTVCRDLDSVLTCNIW